MRLIYIPQTKDIYRFLVLVVFSILLAFLYGINRYTFLESPILNIELKLSKPFASDNYPLVYVSSKNETKINFKNVYRPDKINQNSYHYTFKRENKIRKIRVYFPKKESDLLLKSLELKTSTQIVRVSNKDIETTSGIDFIEEDNKTKLNVLKKNAFIEIPNAFVYSSDFKRMYLLCFFIILLSTVGFFCYKFLNPISLKITSLAEFSICFFLVSIFLPHPIFNIAMMAMAVLNFERIDLKIIKSNKVNVLLTCFFLIYFISNLFLSYEGYREFSTIERLLPIILLSIVLPSISKRKFLDFLLYSAMLLGFVFSISSTVDVFLNNNFEYLSFNFFTKFLHPVYFSYLLFFSICLVSKNYIGYKKYFLELVLFIFLIFSGSKMVFLFSLFIVVITFFKKRKSIIFLLLLIFGMILFTPIKNRFNDILNKKDLSILKESHIENPFDSRINGLSFRLILWRETLKTMDGINYFFGSGVTDKTEDLLKKRLKNLGLTEHINYNPHNQYLDTFWKTGLLGLIFLLSIPLYSFKTALKNKDILLIEFSLFFMAVMVSESVFGRVNGVIFFTTMILILTNTSKLDENSYIGHKRYS